MDSYIKTASLSTSGVSAGTPGRVTGTGLSSTMVGRPVQPGVVVSGHGRE